jgi:hypothetical protein
MHEMGQSLDATVMGRARNLQPLRTAGDSIKGDSHGSHGSKHRPKAVYLGGHGENADLFPTDE